MNRLTIQLFLSFAKIGALGFGGGLAMLPIIFAVADTLGFNNEQMTDLVVISQITPGPLSVNAATYIGFSLSGFLGASMATLGVSVPSFIMVLMLSTLLKRYSESLIIKKTLVTIRPVTIGLVFVAAYLIGYGHIFISGETQIMAIEFLILAGSYIGCRATKLNPIFMIMAGAVIGAIFLR